MEDKSNHINMDGEKLIGDDVQGSSVIDGGEAKSPKKPITYLLFSPETPLGRIMRPVLRWAAAILGLFALGLLAGYIGLYMPTLKEKEAVKVELAAKTSQLDNVSKELEGLKPLYKKALEDLDTANMKTALAKSLLDIGKIRDALDQKDGPGVLKAVTLLETDLGQLTERGSAKYADITGLLRSRLELIKAELNRDPQAVRSDLDILEKTLLDLEKQIG